MKLNEKKTRRQFTPEFKEQAVKRVQSGHKVSVVAKEPGIVESHAPWLGDPASFA